MAGNRFNTSGWPAGGPHRALLDLLDEVHRQHGLRSLRAIGASMNLSYTRVHEIVRGASLPADEQQTRQLVHALAGRPAPELDVLAERAVKHLLAARAVAAPPPAPPDPVPPDGSGPNGSAPDAGRPVRQALIGLGLVVVLAAAALGAWTLWPAGDSRARAATPDVAAFVVAPDRPGGCSSAYAVDGRVQGPVPGRALWVVTQLYAEPALDVNGSLYYPKARLAPGPDGSFGTSIPANTTVGTRRNRFALVVALTPEADAELQLSLDSDIAKDTRYPDGRRLELPPDGLEIVSTAPIEQRC